MRASAGIRGYPKERETGPLVPFVVVRMPAELLARPRRHGRDADPDYRSDDAGGYRVSTPVVAAFVRARASHPASILIPTARNGARALWACRRDPGLGSLVLHRTRHLPAEAPAD